MSPALSSNQIKLFSKPGTGRVEKTIAPEQPGRVQFQGSYWPARLYDPECQATLLPDEAIAVVGRQGITMLVLPIG
ncbi:MAG TPA: NfeD family protein [Chroococcales cyanobacterium]|jgi:membrane protein implicated in regulation of membrane protease activity